MNLSSYNILSMLILVIVLGNIQVKADPSYDHVNCNGRGYNWDGSKCGVCLSPWKGDNCELVEECYSNGVWNGTGCDCSPWTDPSTNCTLDLNYAIVCYFGSAQNDTGVGPYCKCSGSGWGSQCENLYDYKDCITGTVTANITDGTYPTPEPTCECPDETYVLDSGNCNCPANHQYETFGDPCLKIEDPGSSNPKSSNDANDWDKTRTILMMIGIPLTFLSLIATCINTRRWVLEQKEKGNKVTIKNFIYCLPCRVMLFRTCGHRCPCFPSKRKADFFTKEDIGDEFDAEDDEPPAVPPRLDIEESNKSLKDKDKEK